MTESRPRRSDRHARRGRNSLSRRSVVEAAPVMRIHRQRRHHRIRFAMAIGAAVLVVLLVAGALWAYSALHSAQKTMNRNSAEQGDLAAALAKREPEKPFNVLLLGNDHRAGEEKARADTIIVARIDPEQQKVWMLSIPRDTRVEIPGHGVQKINAANFYGGPALVVDTVEEFLGVSINHYMDIDFDGFMQVVDSLGGVWIDVEVEIDDKKAASHGSRKAYHIDPGYQLLDGEYALTFVRSRDFPDADFTRMKHQQQFFKALANRATKLGNVLRIPGIVKDVAQYMATDMTLNQLGSVVMALKDMGGDKMQTATVVGEWRSPYVWPDEERKKFLVDAMLAGRDFDAASTTVDGRIDPSTVSVTIRNGAGIEGCATATSDILKGLGYAVSGVGNANQFVYEETLVVHKDKAAAATQVAGDLPKAKVVASRGMYEFTTDILVVVGKDFATWQIGTGSTSP